MIDVDYLYDEVIIVCLAYVYFLGGCHDSDSDSDSDSDCSTNSPDADTNGSRSNQAAPLVNWDRATGGKRKRATRKQTT